MAGFISFDANTAGRAWSSANWVFRGFLDRVMALAPTDDEVIHELTVSKHSQIVTLGSLAIENPDLHRRVLDALMHACAQIATGQCPVSVDGRELDEESQAQYREAISNLFKMLNPSQKTSREA